MIATKAFRGRLKIAAINNGRERDRVEPRAKAPRVALWDSWLWLQTT